MIGKQDHKSALPGIQAAGLISVLLTVLHLFVIPAAADLRSPGWYDPNPVGSSPDWHYRVPIQIQSGAVDNTVRVDVDFNTLLTTLGVAGTFDVNSPRVVRPNGVLCTTQQYTDAVYAGASDAVGNGRGEIRFLAQDNGTVTYYLYFDILENGAKSAWDTDNTINGNFEFSSNNQEDPPGWTGRVYRSGYQAMAIVNDPGRTVTDNNGNPASVTTDEVALTGQYCYLIGARDFTEPADRNPSTRLERTIAVPATSPGQIRIRYRIKGWDSSDNNYSRWDFLRIQIISGGTTELVGPTAGNYTTLPFSPNLGRNSATSTRSGYGPYNYWDADTTGTHHAGMTLTPGSEPWFTVTRDLSAWAGQTITLRIQTRNSTLYKSWFHIDDVEWSVLDGTLLTPEIFGMNITAPNDTASGPPSIYSNGDTLVIRIQVDAAASSATADVIDPDGDPVQTGIVLFNDGTHGDTVAGDAYWSNDGSTLAQPTYQFLITDPASDDWQVAVQAFDAGSAASSDAQVFSLATPPVITSLKTVVTHSDPINGSTNPKAIPGAFMTYTITVSNQGGGSPDPDSVRVTDPIPANTLFFVGDLGNPWGPVAYIDNAPLSGLAPLDPASDLSFSDDGGISFNLTTADLVPDANGCDSRITHVRINPKGVFNPFKDGENPKFTLQFRVWVR